MQLQLARETAETLNADNEDNWTYKVERRAFNYATIAVYDESGKYCGRMP